MKPIHVYFKENKLLTAIEVLIYASEEDEQVGQLMRKLSAAGDQLLIADTCNVTTAVPMDDIIRITVSGKKLSIQTEQEILHTQCTLQSMESMLDPMRFIRISRQEIVNLSKVRRFDFSLSGTLRLTLSSGEEVWASRRCISAIRKRITGKG